jgi:hypothetical protein
VFCAAAALCVIAVVLVSRPVTTRAVSAAEAAAQPVTTQTPALVPTPAPASVATTDRD